jgi:hypothetical protein
MGTWTLPTPVLQLHTISAIEAPPPPLGGMVFHLLQELDTMDILTGNPVIKTSLLSPTTRIHHCLPSDLLSHPQHGARLTDT